MSDTRVKQHPTLGILVCTDGHVMVPQSCHHKAHWTYGWNNGHGYMQVKIDGKCYCVHRLIAETYLGQIPRGMEVDHLNRVRDDNRVENLRIVTSSENSRNTTLHDRVDARSGTHKYKDGKQYWREQHARYYKAKCKTHQLVHFADGIQRWIPHEAAREFLKIPVKQRVFNK